MFIGLGNLNFMVSSYFECVQEVQILDVGPTYMRVVRQWACYNKF